LAGLRQVKGGSMDPYMMRSTGARTWHIPGDNSLPLCGAAIDGPEERLYLPGKLAPSDVTCPTCLALQRKQDERKGAK
jgi:hypothetical protein